MNYAAKSSTSRRPHHLYRGHRRSSFHTQDTDELVELRARSRTYDGAYFRTTLGNLGYALMILKIFTKEFARIGLMYVILALLLLLVSWKRQTRSVHDFADEYVPRLSDHDPTPPPPPSAVEQAPSTILTPSVQPNSTSSSASLGFTSPPHAASVPVPSTTPAPVPRVRVWGRAYRTSGDTVFLIGFVCTALYAAIFALLMRL